METGRCGVVAKHLPFQL